MNNIENIQEYIPTVYVNDSEPDLDETNLNKTEQAIKRVTDAANKAIDALKQLDREKLALSAISNVLSDATDKVPSLALANTMQLAINDLNSNLANGYPSSICVKDELENSLIKIQGFADGNAGISLNKADGTKYRIFLNADGRLRYGKYINAWNVSDVLTNADYEVQTITNSYGININLIRFGNDNVKVIRLSGYINKALTARTEYIIATNAALKSRVDWYHNVFVSGKGSELKVYLNIDKNGNVKITPHTAIASGLAINMMEYYV